MTWRAILHIACLAWLLAAVSCASGRPTSQGTGADASFFHAAQPPPGGTQKWNPVWWFGNADDPVPPDWYRPGQSVRGPMWQLRNPLHNFTFYVIGVHDKEFVRRGNQPGAVFRKGGGWNVAVIDLGWMKLPFVSYQGRYVRWYALWREKGNFGLKLQLNRKD